MKRIVFSMMACAIFFTACNDAPDADKAETADAVKIDEQANALGTVYAIDKEQSKIEWVGTKPTGRHHGTFKIKDGSLTVADNNITGGRFVIDVASVQPDDQDAEGNAKLQAHLKSADFFDVEKHPEGVFEISSVEPMNGESMKEGENATMKDATHKITGNLTLKGETKSVTFPAVVSVENGRVTAHANFNIDRTDWNMNYKSDSSLGDKLIHKEVNLQVHLVANGQGA